MEILWKFSELKGVSGLMHALWWGMVSLLMVYAASSGAINVPEGRILDRQPKQFGDDASGRYEVSFSAFPSTFISPAIANAYSLKRGPKTGYVNITVCTAGQSETGSTVKARLSGTAVNLLGQRSALDFIEINEGEQAIYYLADFRFTHQEQLKFNITMLPDGRSGGYHFDFRQTFYEDGK